MNPVRESVAVLSLVLMAWFSGTASAETTVAIPDPNLQAAIRSALSKPAGDLTSLDLQSLTGLYAYNANITNLSGLAWATNLTTLHVGANSIQDLTALQNLSQLTSLFLYNNLVRDVSPLIGLTNLSYLVLSYNPVTNYDALLTGFTNLTSLYLGGNSISNVTFLQNLNQLTFLGLDNNKVSDLAPLAALTKLSGLDLSYNLLTDFAQLGGFTNLTSLYLSGNAISNLTTLQPLNRLTSLTLYRNSISDLAPLSGLTNLCELGLSWNPVTNYTELAALTNLTSLWLDGNSISNLSFVEGFTALKALSLRYDRLTNLGSLGGLTNLVSLFADYNRLTRINMLQMLPSLSRAELVGNLLDLSTNSQATAVIESLLSRQVDVAYQPQNQPPNLSVAANWAVPTDVISSLPFNVSDDITPGDQLLVSASSSNIGLIANGSILFAGTNYNRTLTLSPAANQTGTATITVTVIDNAGLSTSCTLTVAVLTPQVVLIPDPNLKAAIRSELGTLNDDFTNVDLQALTNLFSSNTNINDLSGLEWATNLASLYVNGNSLSNLSVLPTLPSLRYFSLNNNIVADLSQLTALTNLTGLRLHGVSLSNLTFLQNMPQLTSLSLETNLITDLSPLTWLTNLNFLSLQQNLLTNILPVQNLPRLAYVKLNLNLLDLGSNSPAQTVINNMQDRGINVDYLPQRGPPIFSVRGDWFIAANVISSLSFSVADDGPSSDLVLVTAGSSNPDLLTDASLIVSQVMKAYWVLTVAPTTNQTGTTTITLTATDDAGLSKSTTILVTVASPLALNDQVLNATNLTWVFGGNAPWFGQNIISHDGVSAARSGSIGDSQESWLETTVTGPGTLSFWWRVSSETGYDWLKLYLDGAPQTNSISGEVGWQQQVVNLANGVHILRWTYSKDRAVSSGVDAAWLDEVTFVPQGGASVPLSRLELYGHPTNGQCQLIIHGAQGNLYEVQASTNLVNWSALGVVATTNSAMPFVDTGASFPARFYRLRELPASSIWLEIPSWPTNGLLQLVLHSPPGMRFEMQASTNLVNWSVLATITNALGTVAYTDPLQANSPRRFYRAAVVP